ncbi:MAG: ABC-2 family transporter protein [Opitutae bacterium]|nr:ABC-2 family transporter protein [Opitutae bacterium]
MTLGHYARLWLASARYAIIRTLMFRFDFFLWSLVEFTWMLVNLLLVEVLYDHTSSIAGWTKYEMLLLVGTSMIVQRLFTGFFWSNLFEVGRNVRSGHFDFFLAQPGNPLFMISTRKLDPDGLINSLVGLAVVIYSANKLGLHPGALDLAAYALLIGCGVILHYSTMVLIIALSFWITSSQGIEGSYFVIYQFSRLPREAFTGFVSRAVFVFLLPAVIVSNIPANILRHGADLPSVAWMLGATLAWFALALAVFQRGLRRYSSASS